MYDFVGRPVNILLTRVWAADKSWLFIDTDKIYLALKDAVVQIKRQLFLLVDWKIGTWN